MSVESRNRMISFRLSAEEYNRCRQTCLDRGIASVSEFARDALVLLADQPSAGGIERRLALLETRLEELTREIKNLTSLDGSIVDS